jgi:hypothetical protein
MKGGKRAVEPKVGGRHPLASAGTATILDGIENIRDLIKRIIISRVRRGPRRRSIRATISVGKIIISVAEGGWMQDVCITTDSPGAVFDFIAEKFRDFECSLR